MIVILPPSETKRSSGTGPPLSLSALSFAELTPVRQRLISILSTLSPAESRTALRLSERQERELQHNRALQQSPTCAAIDRYTGVLYDSLEASTLPPVARSHLLICSALFGLVRAEDRIPPYRLSGNSQLPSVGSLRTAWRPALGKVLSTMDGPVIDLRSGAYSTLAPLPSAITVRVVTSDGKIVSHHNKSTKGKLARALALSPIRDVTELITIAQSIDLLATQTGPTSLDVVFA